MKDREPRSDGTLLQGRLALLVSQDETPSQRESIRREPVSVGRMALPPAPPLRMPETRMVGSQRGSARPLRSLPAEDFQERFVPQEKIATGGMGVLRRYHDTVLGRDVVAKEIRPDQRDSDEARRRFLREAQIQANLQHPCIVPVYDVGNPSTAEMFFTMAHVQGTTLREVITGLRAGIGDVGRRFSKRTLLEAFCRVCLAVEYAHERGVVHRDLKPENIMLGDYGEVWVLDWGIAKRDVRTDRRSSGVQRTDRPPALTPNVPKVYDEDEESPSSLTGIGETMGTLEYLAPEQYIAAGRLDGRTDVYALGAMLYEILSLRWFRDAPRRADLVRLVWQETFSPLERPPIPGIAAELDAIWRRATSTKRDDRFGSAREMHGAITAHLDGERDREKAREEAMKHARDAAMEIEKEGASAMEAEERRERALRKLGRALAMDPSQGEALAALVNSLVEHENPEEIHPAVEGQVRALDREVAARHFRLSTYAYGAWFLFLVMEDRLLGVRNRPAMAAIGAIVLGLVIYNGWLARHHDGGRRHMIASMVLGFVAVGATSMFLGPMILVPLLSAAMFTAFATSLRSDRTARLLGMGLSVASVAVPAALQAAGLIPASYVFEAERIVVLSRLVTLRPDVMRFMMPAGSVMVVAFANLSVLGVIAALSRSERATLTQVHRLRQLVPGRTSMSPPSG